jgi:hypothetical protein
MDADPYARACGVAADIVLRELGGPYVSRPDHPDGHPSPIWDDLRHQIFRGPHPCGRWQVTDELPTSREGDNLAFPSRVFSRLMAAQPVRRDNRGRR